MKTAKLLFTVFWNEPNGNGESSDHAGYRQAMAAYRRKVSEHPNYLVWARRYTSDGKFAETIAGQLGS